MANEEHLAILRQGVDAWNAWREKDPKVKPDLVGANLRMANLKMANLSWAKLDKVDLSEANLSWTNLGGAHLHGANLSGANLYGAYLRADLSEADLTGANLSFGRLFDANCSRADLSGANLSRANISKANLNKANLSGANLSKVNLSKANLNETNLSEANLQLASLVDAQLNRANLTGAKLWESQRDGWSITNVICQTAFWDRDGKEPTNYEDGEFERILAEKPRIILRYSGGMSPVDLLALPMVVERLQADQPESELHIRSVQNEAGGASVTIIVEDRAGRSPEVFGQEMVRIQAKLECIVEERDRLQQRLDLVVPQVLAEVGKFLALPRQEVHVHHPTGLTTIEGTAMTRDTYNIPGQAGAVGPGAQARNNTFQQIQAGTGIDLPKLADELGRLRAAMKGETTGTREQDKAIGVVADAEEAATKGDGPAVLQYLKGAGEWTLGIAEKIGVPVAIEVLKRVIG
jgi:uncharacterized protein YjbI with pentapeptide repeats